MKTELEAAYERLCELCEQDLQELFDGHILWSSTDYEIYNQLALIEGIKSVCGARATRSRNPRSGLESTATPYRGTKTSKPTAVPLSPAMPETCASNSTGTGEGTEDFREASRQRIMGMAKKKANSDTDSDADTSSDTGSDTTSDTGSGSGGGRAIPSDEARRAGFDDVLSRYESEQHRRTIREAMQSIFS